jgi:hypothetical protein
MSDNLPLYEQYRIAALDWTDKEAAASLLEDLKSATLAQKMTALGDMPVSRAEMQVKASPAWMDYVGRIVEARQEANVAKVHLEYLKMRFQEWQSQEANHRIEARL